MNKEKIDLLLKKYEKMLYKAARQRHLKTIFNDAFSQAQLSFLEAVKTYEPAKNIPFPAYAKAKVYGDIYSFFRREKKYWQKQPLSEFAADSPSSLQLADTAQKQYQEQKILNALHETFNLLSPQQKKVIWAMYYLGLTQQETAACLQISQQGVNNLHQKAIKNLRQELSSEYEGRKTE